MSLTSRAATNLARRTTPFSAIRQSTAAVVQQRRNEHSYDSSTSHAEFTSPFHRGKNNAQDTTVIPSFKKYRSGQEIGGKVFQYFMVGALGGVSALGAKETVQSESIHDYSPDRPGY